MPGYVDGRARQPIKSKYRWHIADMSLVKPRSTWSSVLPPRSTAGQLTLDQHIGVRIPGGQPIFSILPYLTVRCLGQSSRTLRHHCSNQPIQEQRRILSSDVATAYWISCHSRQKKGAPKSAHAAAQRPDGHSTPFPGRLSG